MARSLDKDVFVSVEPLEENVRRGLEPARYRVDARVVFIGPLVCWPCWALIIAATAIYGMKLSAKVLKLDHAPFSSVLSAQSALADD